jgi:acetoin utilization deacetylase AcuC-like enzyme
MIFYHPKMSVKEVQSFSPSSGKPEKFIEAIHRENYTFTFKDVIPAAQTEFYLAHDKYHVDEIFKAEKPNGFGNYSQDVLNALPWVCGSMIGAVEYALKYQTNTLSPSSGAHHAGHDFSSSFCTFNFLVIAAIKANQKSLYKIVILDLDEHHGNGTEDIIQKLHLSWLKNYSYALENITKEHEASAWIEKLPQILKAYKDADLWIVNAGVDCHVDDPLGGGLTTNQIQRRDEIIAQAAKEYQIPCALSFAGGYQEDFKKVIDLHISTAKVFNIIK